LLAWSLLQVGTQHAKEKEEVLKKSLVQSPRHNVNNGWVRMIKIKKARGDTSRTIR
jgi:uncharacterized membrane protein YcaP (DUF421 family)